MISEFRRSIESILQHRVTSPLYGTLIVTWLIWNWKIWYLTLFIDSTTIDTNKINFIVNNYNDINLLVFYPIVSTVIVLTLIPFVSNGAFWLDTKFTTWRINEKNRIEGKQLLSLEQSIQLRNELSSQEERFDKVLAKKNEEIEILKKQVEEFVKQNKETETKTETVKRSKIKGVPNNQEIGAEYSTRDFSRLESNKDAYDMFDNVVKHIKEKKQFPETIPPKVKDFFIVNEIVNEIRSDYGGFYYEMTNKGRQLYKTYFNLNYNKK